MSAGSAMAEAPDAPWPELDRCCVQGDRRAAPPFPVEVIAESWRPWIESHARPRRRWQVNLELWEN